MFCLKDYAFNKARIFVKENKLKASVVFPESSDSRGCYCFAKKSC